MIKAEFSKFIFFHKKTGENKERAHLGNHGFLPYRTLHNRQKNHQTTS